MLKATMIIFVQGYGASSGTVNGPGAQAQGKLNVFTLSHLIYMMTTPVSPEPVYRWFTAHLISAFLHFRNDWSKWRWHRQNVDAF